MRNKIYLLVRHRIALIVKTIPNLLRFLLWRTWKEESYYPEKERKSSIRIFLEQLWYLLITGKVHVYYFAYGLDVKNWRKMSDYMDDEDFLWKASLYNRLLVDSDYTCILRDKSLFETFLTSWGYATPRVVYNTKIIQPCDIVKNLSANGRGGYFCKPFDGQCGQGVFKILCREGEILIEKNLNGAIPVNQWLMEKFDHTDYLIQTLVQQHDAINEIYDKSINTIRLITIYDEKQNKIIPFSAVLRVGAHGNVVDNWAQGGLNIGIDLSSGTLLKYSVYKHGKGTKTTKHPDSGFVFDGFRIPFFTEAIKQACSLHEHLKAIKIIGWDIAITNDGPLFIEGNDNPEISLNQCACGGLKTQIETILNI